MAKSPVLAAILASAARTGTRPVRCSAPALLKRRTDVLLGSGLNMRLPRPTRSADGGALRSEEEQKYDSQTICSGRTGSAVCDGRTWGDSFIRCWNSGGDAGPAKPAPAQSTQTSDAESTQATDAQSATGGGGDAGPAKPAPAESTQTSDAEST